jgi:glycogen debranching enzyme
LYLKCTFDSLLRIAYSALALTLAQAAGARAEPGYPAFAIRETALTLHAEATARRFIAAHGRRGMIAGYSAESLEGWVYPFRIFHDYRIGFRPQGSAGIVPGETAAREVIVKPESVTRVYSGQNFTVRETLFVPLDEGGFEILYGVNSPAPMRIVVSFRPDLDLMWPGGIGGQSFGWDPDHHAFTLVESSGKYSALVGSPVAEHHSAPDSYTEPWQADRTLSLELDFPANSGDHLFPLVASLTAPPYYAAARTYDSLLGRTSALYTEAVEHYGKLLASGVQVETPDHRVDLAYTWARIALDQAYVCNPWLGCGLVAGYGPSRDTRRPQYAWFFGGDALNNTFALEASGDHALARDAIRFIQKYQKKDDGGIFHELSQSAGLIDWFKEYPYAYRHTDVSAMYLVALRNLYRASGDIDFVRSSWDSIKAAYRYLVSRVDSSDGLVTIPPGGWGGDETIGEQVVKDVYLESVWVAGAEAFEGLAHLVRDHELAGDAHGRAEKARASLGAKFWNPGRDFFLFGFNGKGQPLTQELSEPWGMWVGVFDEEKSNRALDNLAHARWETDWGTRSIPTDDPLYIGDSYGHGSVWPLGTGFQALAFSSHHRPLQAFPLWRALVEQSFLNSLGHVPEVLSGDFYRELNVSVPEQIWSSGILITTFVRGVLGLEPYAPMSELHWTPHLPPDWSGVSVKNVQVGRSTLTLRMKQSETGIGLEVDQSGPPVAITFAPEIPLGTRNLRATLNGRTATATIRSYEQDAHAEVKFSGEPSTEVALSFEPGVRPWVHGMHLAIGDESHGLRVLSSRLEGRTYSARVEGRPNTCAPFSITTPWSVKHVDGGNLSAHQGNEWTFMVSTTPGSCDAQAAAPAASYGPYKEWTLRVEFAP